MKDILRDELNQIFELDSGLAGLATGLAIGGTTILATKLMQKKICKKKYPNDPERAKKCAKAGLIPGTYRK